MPFVLSNDVKDYFDIATSFSAFNFIVMGAGSLFLTILIARRLSKDNRIAVGITASIALLFGFCSQIIIIF